MAYLDIDVSLTEFLNLYQTDTLTTLLDFDTSGSRITSMTIGSSQGNRYTVTGDIASNGQSGTVTGLIITEADGDNILTFTGINLSLAQATSLSGDIFEQQSLSGDDQILLSTGADTISGYDGNDVIYGGGSANAVIDGNDTLFGGSGEDTVWGNAGNDYVVGGNSLVDTSDAADTIIGGAGQDSIFGNAGNDFLIGGEDYLDFDDAADTIYGGLGNDLLVGAGGDDRLIGGNGNDIFVLAQNAGTDTIVDFTSGQDVISVQGTSYEVLGTDGSHSFLQTDTGTGVLVLWTIPDELQTSDFFYWS